MLTESQRNAMVAESPSANYEDYSQRVGDRYVITEIDWASFPADCQPGFADADLPIEIRVPIQSQYRIDAAQCGLLVHSPYCPHCAE